MSLTFRAVVVLRILLVLLFVALLVGQTLSIPGQLAHLASQSPVVAPLRWPLLIVAVLGMLCGQIVIVCTWRLLSMVMADRIFSEDAFVWVNAILTALTTAWALLLATTVFLSLVLFDDPGTPMLMFGMVLAGGTVVLLMYVMRALLRQATTLRTEMDGVI
ncbi:MAG TPA: DUF2975 domain-containing protein [Microlunatus sp.]|nr:DUF2975 domain-containing protein [Microlunatus sp.]